jgi:hypothetical protein
MHQGMNARRPRRRREWRAVDRSALRRARRCSSRTLSWCGGTGGPQVRLGRDGLSDRDGAGVAASSSARRRPHPPGRTGWLRDDGRRWLGHGRWRLGHGRGAVFQGRGGFVLAGDRAEPAAAAHRLRARHRRGCAPIRDLYAPTVPTNSTLVGKAGHSEGHPTPARSSVRRPPRRRRRRARASAWSPARASPSSVVLRDPTTAAASVVRQSVARSNE